MSKSLQELEIGTFKNIEVAYENTTIITALRKFIERRVSALPIIDHQGKLLDIYAKFDVIVSTPTFTPSVGSLFTLIF